MIERTGRSCGAVWKYGDGKDVRASQLAQA